MLHSGYRISEWEMEMSDAEMNRRLSEMLPKVIAHIERLARNTTYTPREVLAFRIPGSKSLAHINAVFQKALS